MPIVIPDWLKAPDVAQEYSRGLSIGAGVAESQARLRAEPDRNAMEIAARKENLDRQMQMENARLETQKAYHDEQLGLRAQQLDEVASVNAQRTSQAAQKLAAQKKFSSLLQGGATVQDALTQVPELATPQAMIAAHKQASDLSGEKLDLQKRALDLAQERNDISRQRMTMSPNKSGTVGFREGYTGLDLRQVPLESDAGKALIRQYGTNLPPELQGRSAAPSAT